ncbi:class E sortase [Spirillospora sp. CA-294931]|uniref:class E sortase n=1 Tax=Spirillospora sp. CA-294931 TaxID=3240042 RepID=UPI003D8A2577
MKTLTPTRAGLTALATVTTLAATPGASAAEASFARLHIPRIGLSQQVYEGISSSDLHRGIGHYPGTAYPGAKGNSVFLGHRTSGAAPFRDLDRVRIGDHIKFTSGSRTHRYRITSRRIISPSQTEVLEPVPFEPGSAPREKYVTLITCHPKGSDAMRLIYIGKAAP